jgi:hypothetical protein
MGGVNWVSLLPFGVSLVWLKNGAMFFTTSNLFHSICIIFFDECFRITPNINKIPQGKK